MAHHGAQNITPEDILEKQFLSTKFREGYDMDEVDDFLDEIVTAMRELSKENEELARQVEAKTRAQSQE